MQSTTLTVAPIRLFFYSAWKVFYVYGNNGGWNSFFGSFDINASGLGVNGSADWGMTDSDKFIAYVFGYRKTCYSPEKYTVTILVKPAA